MCEVMAVMRDDLIKKFVSWGSDFGPKKTPCFMLFPVKHCQSLIAKMNHDEIDLFVGHIMAVTLQGHHSSSPELRKVTHGQFTTTAECASVSYSFITSPPDTLPDQGHCAVHPELHGYDNRTYRHTIVSREYATPHV